MESKKPSGLSLAKQLAETLEIVEKLAEDNKKLTERLYEVEHILSSTNIAIIGIAYSAEMTPERIEAAKPEEFLKYIEANVHPIIRKSDELTSAVADLAKQEITATLNDVKGE